MLVSSVHPFADAHADNHAVASFGNVYGSVVMISSVSVSQTLMWSTC